MNLIKQNQFNLFKNIFSTIINRTISTSLPRLKHQEQREWQRTLHYRETGEQGINIVGHENEYEKRFLKHVDFPTPDLEKMEFEDGLLFTDLPILELYTHKNNTRLACFDVNYSKIIDYTSAVMQNFLEKLKRIEFAYYLLIYLQGTEGYKNCKKGTTVAAHAAGMDLRIF